jgi:hypothetical protein
VPLLAYVHAEDRDPRPEGPPPWEPNWKIWRWLVAAAVVTYAAVRAEGAIEAVLVLVLFGLVCRAALEAIPDGDGLRHWRQ